MVRYAETHGYERTTRPHAWPYRDYVIRAFNADRPYGAFVRQQVAGDVLEPGSADGVIAMGFIAAGPWDLIGHAEVAETKTDGKVARHLDRDDMVSNTINTFVSLTIQCAQCHNHKFDPITQEDYYRLQAVFAALDRADRPYYSDAVTAHKAASQARAGVQPAGLVYAGTVHNGGKAAFRDRPRRRQAPADLRAAPGRCKSPVPRLARARAQPGGGLAGDVRAFRRPRRGRPASGPGPLADGPA